MRAIPFNYNLNLYSHNKELRNKNANCLQFEAVNCFASN